MGSVEGNPPRSSAVKGGRHDAFLSICIPTYNRALKLGRRLEQFAQIVGASKYRDRVELVVSDNASTDNTEQVLAEWRDRLAGLCPVRIFAQAQNLGAEGNFKFLYEHACGEYVWICSDDDVLFEDQFDPLLADLHEHRPELCISSFRQPPWSDNDRVFMCGGKRIEIVTRVEDAVPSIVKFAKLTPFVYRRRTLRPAEQAVAEQSVQTTAYWFITLSVILFVNYERKLLLRSPNIAHADAGYRDLRFSVRVYATLKDAVLLGLGADPSAQHFRDTLPVPDVTTSVVGGLFRHCMGMSTMDENVVREDFQYVRENLRSTAFSGWRNLVKMPFVLALIPLRRARAR